MLSMFLSIYRGLRPMKYSKIHLFDTFNITWLSTCLLEYGDGVFYPEVGYESESKIRILYRFNGIQLERKRL